jgi:hypothetical protein
MKKAHRFGRALLKFRFNFEIKREPASCFGGNDGGGRSSKFQSSKLAAGLLTAPDGRGSKDQ